MKGASGVSVGLLTVLVLTVNAAAQKPLPKFMGRDVTVSEPPLDDDGFYSKGPASVCVEGPPERQCYTAPQDYGRSPVVRLIQVEKNTSAVFFEVAGGGVSGFPIHFALLRPGFGNQLEDFLLSDDVSNQNQHAFWSASEISPSPIFFTADFVWGVDEAHFSPHRYVISCYVLKHQQEPEDIRYFLEDRYMTVRKYDLDATPPPDILAAEKSEILARLRVKAEQEHQRSAQN